MQRFAETLKISLRGAAAGILGTGLMTLVYVLFDLTITRQFTIAPSQPERLISRMARRAGLARAARPEKRGEAAAIAHFSYGSGWGACYAIAHSFIRVPALYAGIAFGLVTWVIGFVGWLPAMRHIAPPWEQSPARVAASVLSHLAYGLGTSLTYEALVAPAKDTAVQREQRARGKVLM